MSFSPASYSEFKYNSRIPNIVTIFDFINGLAKHIFDLSLPVNRRITLSQCPAYNRSVPITFNKIEDIKKVMKYIPYEYVEYYEDTLKFPTEEN